MLRPCGMYVTVYGTKVCYLLHDGNCGTFLPTVWFVHKQVYEMPPENWTKVYYNFQRRPFLHRMYDYISAAVGVIVYFEINIRCVRMYSSESTVAYNDQQFL